MLRIIKKLKRSINNARKIGFFTLTYDTRIGVVDKLCDTAAHYRLYKKDTQI